MVFSSIIFLFYFLPVLLCFYFLVHKKISLSNGVLLLFSLLFYAWGEPNFILVILLSILLNYSLGILLGRQKSKAWLILGISINLFLLFYFKYITFFISTIFDLFSIPQSYPIIVLPIGISFFTFQAVSYLVDVYNEKVQSQSNICSLALYISLFPQLIAGPIVRYSDIEQQINNRKVSFCLFNEGVRRFIVGLSKKILIANTFAKVVDEIFAMPLSEMTNYLVIIAIISYAFQIYFDFSGYSDMAIGLGKMFGFTFLENFNYPYISKSIQEFWQRWHISLSSFFRDYLYIPLGGNRNGYLKTYRNLLIVFLLCGLWHGAEWKYILWGGYFGFFLIVERIFLGKLLVRLPACISWLYTIFIVLWSWLLFRVDNLQQFWDMIGILLSNKSNPLHLKYVQDHFIIFITGVAIISSTPLFHQHISKSTNKVVLLIMDIFFIFCFILSISFLASSTYNPFIYYRF